MFAKPKQKLEAAGSGGFWEDFAELKGSKDWINSVQLSDDASLVMAGSRAGSIHLWKSPSMGPLAGEWESVSNITQAHAGGEFNAGVISSVAIHPNKRCAYTGGADWDVKMWDIDESQGVMNGRVFGTITSKHTAGIRDINISDHCSLVASSGDDGNVLLWDERTPEAGGCVKKLEVSVKPCSGCMFEPYGLNGGGNWIVTSDEEGCIKVWDLRKMDVSRILYDSAKVHENAAVGGSKSSWEGGSKIDIFKDVLISTEGWICAVTAPGLLYTWDPAKDWSMTKQPTSVNATSLTVSRINSH